MGQPIVICFDRRAKFLSASIKVDINPAQWLPILQIGGPRQECLWRRLERDACCPDQHHMAEWSLTFGTLRPVQLKPVRARWQWSCPCVCVGWGGRRGSGRDGADEVIRSGSLGGPSGNRSVQALNVPPYIIVEALWAANNGELTAGFDLRDHTSL